MLKKNIKDSIYSKILLLIELLSNMAVTIFLLILLMFLVLAATLFQIESGIYETQKIFIESWTLLDLGLPLPSGKLIFLLLSINQLFSFFHRLLKHRHAFSLSIVHLALIGLFIILTVGPLDTNEFTVGIWEGEKTSHVLHPFIWTFTVKDGGDKWSYDFDLRNFKIGDVYDMSDRDFQWSSNQDLRIREFSSHAQAQYLNDTAILLPLSGNQALEARSPALIVDWQGETLPISGGESLENSLEEKTVSLLPKTLDLGFEIQLEDFQVEYYPSSEIPKSFRSIISVIDGSNELRQEIRMNQPLRYNDLAFYQSAFQLDENRAASVLVVRKISSNIPAIIFSIIIILGLLIHLIGLRFQRNSFSKGRKDGKE